MKAFNLRLLVIGLLALTGCKTETTNESSFWQILPFTGKKSTASTAKIISNQPVVAVASTTPVAKPVVTPVKPTATTTPVTPVAQVEKPAAPTKKIKKLPPATAISLPVTPSKKSSTALASDPEHKTSSTTSTKPATAAPPPPSLRLSDWIYNEDAHEQWRQKQLEEAQEKAPRHQYESTQLNRAFYNIILDEPTPSPTTETAKP